MVRVADIISTTQLEIEDGLDLGLEVLIWRTLFIGKLFHWEPASDTGNSLGLVADWSVAGLTLFPCYVGFLNLKSDCFNLHVTGKRNRCITLTLDLSTCFNTTVLEWKAWSIPHHLEMSYEWMWCSQMYLQTMMLILGDSADCGRPGFLMYNSLATKAWLSYV